MASANRNDTPTPGNPDWQQQLNEQVDQHDRQFEQDHPNWQEQHGSTGGAR